MALHIGGEIQNIGTVLQRHRAGGLVQINVRALAVKQGDRGTVGAVIDRQLARQFAVLVPAEGDIDGFKHRRFTVGQLDVERHRVAMAVAVQGFDDHRVHFHHLIGRLRFDIAGATHHGAVELQR
ncbi:hypothetical protein D3C76_1166000 [compost metagenome]